MSKSYVHTPEKGVGEKNVIQVFTSRLTKSLRCQIGFELIVSYSLYSVSVKTCDFSLCCETVVVLLFIVLPSLFSLFHVSGELCSFLNRG